MSFILHYFTEMQSYKYANQNEIIKIMKTKQKMSF